MAEIRLARLPDRTPVKLTINCSPDLDRLLAGYARFYADTYGKAEPVGDLAAAILGTFLESDRAFQAARRSGLGDDEQR